jgi:small GTP-binding protein
MDLRSYEQDKFAIADLVRSASLLGPPQNRNWEERIEELLVRLAEDRFNLVVVGRFSRGKTSLMNAILGTDRLPTGIVPLTSVITTVAYGSSEQVVLKYQGRTLEQEIPLAELARYITQQGNPGNARGLRMAEVQLPVEFLRRGFYFVDTPGLGSAIEENTRTTEGFLPEADALLLVTSFESPLTEEEARIVKGAAASGRHVFVVVNKQDIVTVAERESALRYVAAQLEDVLGAPSPLRIFAVSARDALAAKQRNDETQLLASGIPALEEEVVRFLLREKQTQFLLRMCERVGELMEALPASREKIRLHERLARMQTSVRRDELHPAAGRLLAPVAFMHLHERQSCEVCTHATRVLWDFLCKYQYELVVNDEEKERLAERGGLCSFHTWYYAGLAAPRDICKSYPTLLAHTAQHLRAAIADGDTLANFRKKAMALLANSEQCPFCLVRAKSEWESITSIRQRLREDETRVLDTLSAICMPHFAMLARIIDDARLLSRLMEYQATLCERLAEDMRRYALKHDAIRRFLVSGEETVAAQRGLMLVAGHRHMNTTANADGSTTVEHRSTEGTRGILDALHKRDD